jgi:phosphoribosylpyrophosphate synthetase
MIHKIIAIITHSILQKKKFNELQEFTTPIYKTNCKIQRTQKQKKKFIKELTSNSNSLDL